MNSIGSVYMRWIAREGIGSVYRVMERRGVGNIGCDEVRNEIFIKHCPWCVCLLCCGSEWISLLHEILFSQMGGLWLIPPVILTEVPSAYLKSFCDFTGIAL